MFRLGCSKPFSLRLVASRVSSSLCPRRSPLSSLKPPSTRNPITTKTSPLPSLRPSKTLDPESFMKDLESELFHYTSGRFLANEDLRLRERSRIFNIPGLFEIIAKARNCKTNEVVGFRKLAEGGLNRSFLVTLQDGFKLVARIPYPILIPKAYAYASEVATMDFLHSKGLPVPEVYAYSYTPENEAGTEYMLLEYVEGTDLSEIWFNLEKKEIDSFMDQLAKLESIMMSISFPAGGSIYYATDLKQLSGSEGIPLEAENQDIPLHHQVESISLKEENKGIPLDEQAKPIPQKRRFCLGPDVSIPLWYGKREQMDSFRGPYKDALSVLVTGANKELAYLDQFGSPRAPYRGFRRDCYNIEKQDPSEHANNLRRYLLLSPSLVPADDSLTAFCIRHPDLNLENIKVTTDSNGLQIHSVLDWQHAVVLPLFLHAGMPHDIQHEEDEVSRRMIKPKLPDDFDKLSQDEQIREKQLLRRRLVHYHYILSTMVYNKAHHKGLAYPLGNFCRRIFNYATAPWEGETIKLQLALIEMVVGWDRFAKDGSTPCPVVITPDEIDAAGKLGEELEMADENERMLRKYVGYGPENWVPVSEYERAVASAQEMKQKMLEVYSEDEGMTDEKRALVMACWPLADMDEAEFEEYL